MPIEIIDKRKCTGCEACINICPKSCINMEDDFSGFQYPVVDYKKCINCDLCTRTCPVIHVKVDTNIGKKNIDVYACWSLDEELRYHSTSGGVFSELSKKVMEEGGFIVGAAYDNDCNVEHIIGKNDFDLSKIRQSKYTQSKIGKIFIQIKELLNKGEKVLFCGAPCQILGLKKFLNKEYENLISVDFICRGVNSPKAYRYWLEELEGKYKSKAIRVWFKYKIGGWKKSPMCTRIDFQNGQVCVQKGNKNYYMRGYLGPNLYIRPSCSKCKFKSEKRSSDITLADFWGISKMLDDDQGTSLMLIHTENGRKLFEQCRKNLFVNKRTMDEILEGNTCFIDSVKINLKSEEFLHRLGEKPFSMLVKEYTYMPLYFRVKNKMLRVLKKIVRSVK